MNAAGAIELCQSAALDGFLVKPFRAETLLRFLDVLLGERPPAPPAPPGRPLHKA